METVNDNSKIVDFLLVCSIVSLFFFLLQSNHTHAQDSRSEQHQTHEENTNSQDGPNHDFYRVIVENNLFRPLGWKKPKQAPEYVLIATLIESRGETAKALLREQKSNRVFYVRTGEKVGRATIENIEATQVILNISGKNLTLKLPSIQFLNPTQPPNGASQSLGASSRQFFDNTTSQRTHQNQIDRNQRYRRQDRDNSRKNWRERLRDQFRNATSEDRRKLIEMFRQR